jgi:hypothetical protein
LACEIDGRARLPPSLSVTAQQELRPPESVDRDMLLLAGDGCRDVEDVEL